MFSTAFNSLKNLTKCVCCLLLFLSFEMISQERKLNQNDIENNIEYDNYGRVVKTSSGEKINYDFDPELQQSLQNQQKLAATASSTLSQTYCDPAWKYSIMGTCIGRRSLKSLDIDNNGTIDILANAQVGMGGFWYTMNYNATKNIYEQTWVSPYYSSYPSYITTFDINNDNVYEIFVGFNDGVVRVFDGSTKTLINTIQPTNANTISDIEFSDADNDGTKEIVISDGYKLYFINSSTYTIQNQLSFSTYDLAIGNVDNTPGNEIVSSSGKVLKYNGTTLTTQWVFQTSINGFPVVDLSDTDSDGKKEIFELSNSGLYVYDADIQSTKYSILTNTGFEALLLIDLNGDNIDEIVYGDGQWGKIHCVNAVTQVEQWFINNPDNGVTSISIADVDQNGDLEVLWAANWGTTGADYLYVYDLNTTTQQWKSDAIDGPFYGMQIADIDNDGSDEIVAVSYSSESGYKSGILMVFDATTHELEWKCNGTFFNMVWTGIYDLKIRDIDNDGVKDIIVAAGQTYTGKIWIVDGVTKALKSSHLFPSGTKEFYSLDIDDVDGDGNLDIVAINDKINIIDPLTYVLKWSSPAFTSGYYSKVMISNIDNDANKEIVVCFGLGVYVADAVTHQVWQSNQLISTYYNTFDLLDFNADGIKDIICGGYTTGNLDVLDYNNQQIVSTSTVTLSYIDGLLVTDLNNDGNMEIIFSSGGKIFFKTSSNIITVTEKYGSMAGGKESIRAFDIDGDGKKELFIGASTSILQLSPSCYQCIWFDNAIHKNNVSCLTNNDGSINLNPTGGALPYSFSWNTSSTNSSINNLTAGNYSFTITDNNGCSITDSIAVVNSSINATLTSTNIPCTNSNGGSANINVNIGTVPYTYSWSNGSSQSSNTNLSVGNYSATVTDSMHCTQNFIFSIVKDTVIAVEQVYNVSCNGDSSGYISLYASTGSFPYTFQWNNGYTTSYLYGLPIGIYSYTVTDSKGCVTFDSVLINEPPSILIYSSSTPDDPNTSIGDGTGSITVSGGGAPYSVVWSDPFNQTTPTVTNLYTGNYTVTVTDVHGCSTSTVVFVNTDVSVEELGSINNISVFPSPTNSYIYFTGTADKFKVQITDMLGHLLIEKSFEQSEGDKSINLSMLSNAVYFCNIYSDKHLMKRSKIVLSR